jgi:hypothetical protein
MAIRATNGEIAVDAPRRAGRPRNPGTRMYAVVRLRVSEGGLRDLEARAAERGIEVVDLVREAVWPDGEPR